MVNKIFLFILIFIIKQILKKKNINQFNIDEKNIVTNRTISLFLEYNEPCLINLKDKELFDFYHIYIKRYLNEIDFSNFYNPILSIIIPVYNGKKFLIRSLLSIYAQSFKNFEIIYIDDNSMDNSSELIKDFQKIDKRIKLFINQKNKGTLYAKSFGVTKSKGKFVIIMDQDDIYIDKDLFLNLIEISEKNNLDILQFKYNDYSFTSNLVSYDKIKFSSNENNIIYQPELGNIDLYLNESLYKSFFIWDKLIKRKVYVKALDFLGDKQWSINLVHREDHLMTFALYKIANNYMKINNYGYSHIENENQESKDYYRIKNGLNVSQDKREKMLLYQFQFSKFLYDNTKKNLKEKKIAIRELLKTVKNINFTTKVNKKNIRNLVINVSNNFLKSNFMKKEQKKILLNFINIFYLLNYKSFYKINLINFFKFIINIK